MSAARARTLVIAGRAITIESDDESLLARIDERYAGFLAEGAPEGFTLAVTVDQQARVPGQHPVWVQNPEVGAQGDLDTLELRGEGFVGTLDLPGGSGHATIPDSLAHLDLFVRIALGVGLLREGETLLHAAAVLRDSFGVVFSGPSGAGKSTIAGLCRDDGLTVLADEMVVVRRSGLGVRVHGSPFWHGVDRSGPAGALFFLAHAKSPAIERVSPERALPELMRAGGAPVDLPAVQEAFFETLAGLLRRVPAYRLSFAPHSGFWAAVDALPEFHFFRPRARGLSHAAPAANAGGPRPMTRLPSSPATPVDGDQNRTKDSS